MRELNINERQLIAGGIGEDVLITGGIAVAAIAVGYGIYSYFSGPKVVPITSTYDITKPIYNSDGEHIANEVKTYSHTDYIVR